VIYQILLSKSNGGRDAVASSYRSFLKGGQALGRIENTEHEGKTTTEEAHPDPALQMIVKEDQHEIEEDETKVAHIEREHDPFLKENEVEFEEVSAQVLQIVREDDPFSKENEVESKDDPDEALQIIRQHDPFSKENEVKYKDNPDEAPQIIRQRDPFSKENESEFEDDTAEVPQIVREHDPFSKENEEDGENIEFAPAFATNVIENELPMNTASVPSYVFDPHHQIFHNYNKGKSGKVVREMLMAHAYIFEKKATYGGCCGDESVKMSVHEDLLDSLGLNGPLRFSCPRDFVQDSTVRRSVIPRDRYMAEDTRIWTPVYVDYLRSLVTYPEKRHKGYTIVVHMLRGNTTPCKEQSRGFYSYLPNLHYLKLIDKYMQPGAQVIIYTSAKSFEDLNEFRNLGYEVNTGTSLKDTWKDYVTADVFIMSRSDFSMVPAMVAKGIVVYTPFWHRSLRRWERAGKSIMRQTEKETIRLQDTRCVFPIG